LATSIPSLHESEVAPEAAVRPPPTLETATEQSAVKRRNPKDRTTYQRLGLTGDFDGEGIPPRPRFGIVIRLVVS
jgi:hypothetical protein